MSWTFREEGGFCLHQRLTAHLLLELATCAPHNSSLPSLPCTSTRAPPATGSSMCLPFRASEHQEVRQDCPSSPTPLSLQASTGHFPGLPHQKFSRAETDVILSFTNTAGVPEDISQALSRVLSLRFSSAQYCISKTEQRIGAQISVERMNEERSSDGQHSGGLQALHLQPPAKRLRPVHLLGAHLSL